MYTFDYQRPRRRGAAPPPRATRATSPAARASVQAMKLRLSSSERLVDLGSAIAEPGHQASTAARSWSAR